MLCFQAFIFISLVLATTLALPAPQSDDYDDNYGDYDESVAGVGEDTGGVGDILRSGAGLAGSLLSLFSSKVKFINMLLTDKVMVCTYIETKTLYKYSRNKIRIVALYLQLQYLAFRHLLVLV